VPDPVQLPIPQETQTVTLGGNSLGNTSLILLSIQRMQKQFSDKFSSMEKEPLSLHEEFKSLRTDTSVLDREDGRLTRSDDCSGRSVVHSSDYSSEDKALNRGPLDPFRLSTAESIVSPPAEPTVSPPPVLSSPPPLATPSADAQWSEWKCPKPDNNVVISEADQMVTFLDANEVLIYDSSKSQVNKSGLRPRYRFRKFERSLEPTKISSAILPVCQAFKDFGRWAHSHSKVVQARQVFHPTIEHTCSL